MKTLHCEWCGQRESNEYPVWGHKESAEAPYFVSHQTRGYCVMAALTRAEAAEGLAYERLEAALFAEQRATDAELRAEEAAAEANDAAKELIELQERFDAMDSIAKYDQQQLIEMAARVAELEAALAAQQWRPGSETPPPDWYQTVETIEGVFSHTYFDGASWHGYYDDLPPLWYRPIPPLPPAPQETQP